MVRRGALVGAVGLGLLQYLSTFLIGRFSSNPAFAIFGSVIALMLFFNLFARLILIMAAWIATARHPAVPRVPAPAGARALTPSGSDDLGVSDRPRPAPAAGRSRRAGRRTRAR